MLGKYKKRFFAYLNKEDFDHTQGLVDPFAYHGVFHLFAELFSVMDYETLPKWMFISPVGTLISGIMAATICAISLSHFVQRLQIHLITECGTYLLVMFYKLIIVWTLFNNKEHYHILMRALRSDFLYICTRGKKYREGFFANQRVTFKACIIAAIFTGSVGVGMNSSALISLGIYLSREHDEDSVGRPLPFPFWLFGYNLHVTPVYEILFILSVLFTFFHTYNYIFMMLCQVIWVREITCKADVITWSIQDVLVDIQPAKNKEESEYYIIVIQKRMREIVSMHHSMFDLLNSYAAVYKKCLLFEQKLATPVICMTAFCFAEKYDAGEVKAILAILCCSAVGVVFIPSYLCTHLLEKIQSVSDACWDMPFWNAGPVVRPYLVLMMQRSMRQLPLVNAGFEDISLQTYSNLITRAYSYFNMLRQANFDLS